MPEYSIEEQYAVMHFMQNAECCPKVCIQNVFLSGESETGKSFLV
jgi:hypothetical protein